MLDTLKNIKYTIGSLQARLSQITTEISLNTENLQEKELQYKDIVETKELYKKAIDVIYENSVQELKSLLNTVLTNAFVGRNFEMDIVISDKRGKSLTFVLYENGKPVNLKVGTGMGVKSVISAVLQMYYIQCKGSDILLIDETYSKISASYVDEFFAFLKTLCDRLGFKIVMITHDERFLQYADKSYTFNLGKVTCHERTK